MGDGELAYAVKTCDRAKYFSLCPQMDRCRAITIEWYFFAVLFNYLLSVVLWPNCWSRWRVHHFCTFRYIPRLEKLSIPPPALPYSDVSRRPSMSQSIHSDLFRSFQVQLWSKKYVRNDWTITVMPVGSHLSVYEEQSMNSGCQQTRSTFHSPLPREKQKKYLAPRFVLTSSGSEYPRSPIGSWIPLLYHNRILFTLSRRWHSLRVKKFRFDLIVKG